MKLSVVVPAYNEARHIARNVKTLDTSLRSLGGGSYEVIVVDDGSTDCTFRLARDAARSCPHVTVIRCTKNSGKGFALCCGFAKARGELIAFIDADLDLHPDQLGVIIGQLERAEADLAIGSKLHPRSRVSYPWPRRMMSWWYRMLICILFDLNVRDTQVGLKVFNRAVLDEVIPRLVVKRFAFDVELLAVARYYGYSNMLEVPVSLDYRFTTTVKLRDIRNMFQDTLGIFYRLRIRRYYQRQRSGPVATTVRGRGRPVELTVGPVGRLKARWRKRN